MLFCVFTDLDIQALQINNKSEGAILGLISESRLSYAK